MLVVFRGQMIVDELQETGDLNLVHSLMKLFNTLAAVVVDACR